MARPFSDIFKEALAAIASYSDHSDSQWDAGARVILQHLEHRKVPNVANLLTTYSRRTQDFHRGMIDANRLYLELRRMTRRQIEREISRGWSGERTEI
jgi:hypothetical protein